ncbi:MAG TPA: saccharopine dehydrogenase NADP-binding domain-containing protein [Actinocrinis sp.]|nr:saccharopine dehydrogenase NADP-binding domain-containing protein [Actinocrinis sp.]
MPQNREFDLVLFGATGFTGALAAEYLAANAPADCRWALAGRDRTKLEAVRTRLAGTIPACADLPLLVVDATDDAALEDLASRARVVISTVGPYLLHGEPLVAACAAAGTDYVDLTGEPEFVDRMYLRYHAKAVASGARIVHACGFDSIPHDLGVLFTVNHLPDDVPITVDGFVRASGTFSGGTLASVLTAFSRVRSMARTAKERRAAEPAAADRRGVRGGPGRLHRPTAPLSGWAVPLPTIDPQIVARSAAALPGYGPDFRYRHHASVKHLPVVLGSAAGLSALFLAAQVPPLRDALVRVRASGAGPDAETRARSRFSIRFVGQAGGERIVTEVSGGDPGYGETAKMLVESALCLAYDEVPPTSGQVTTATAMGSALIERLIDAGLRFTVLVPLAPSSANTTSANTSVDG